MEVIHAKNSCCSKKWSWILYNGGHGKIKAEMLRPQISENCFQNICHKLWFIVYGDLWGWDRIYALPDMNSERAHDHKWGQITSSNAEIVPLSFTYVGVFIFPSLCCQSYRNAISCETDYRLWNHLKVY